MLSIVADINIPRVIDAFSSIGHVEVMAAESITAEICREVDILLVRSVTRVNASLLDQSNVAFVGSASAGSDHINQSYLRQREIAFAHAPGSNADSVVEYVLTALVRLSAMNRKKLEGLTLGIIGCGNIGGRLARRAPAFGLNVLKNDPPVANSGGQGFVDLETVLAESDILTLHVPKHTDTYHLISDAELEAIKPGAWIINAARGDVVNNQALKKAIMCGHIDGCVLDVWENEPTPDMELLDITTLGTPHIAGHSVDGKLWGTIMLYQAVTKHFEIQPTWDYEALLRLDLPEIMTVPLGANWLDRFVKHLYNIDSDSKRMRELLSVPETKIADGFRRLRRTYPPRRAFDLHILKEVPPSYLDIIRDGLCVSYLYPKDRKK